MEDRAAENFAADTVSGCAVNAIAIEGPIEMLTSTGRIEGRTDREGKLMVKIEEGCKTRLHTVAMGAGDGKTQDWASYWASLTFEVASGKGGESTNLTSR